MFRSLFFRRTACGCCLAVMEVTMEAHAMDTRFSGTRPAVVAGQFYPAGAEALKKQVDACLKRAARAMDSTVRAVIVPHAGYTYSGDTAGRAYALIQGREDIRRVVIIHPSHRAGFEGVSLGGYAAFQTPLGGVPVDTAACGRLLKASALFSSRNDAHAAEHSLEVQLPFLQRCLGDFSLVPVACGFLTEEQARELGKALADSLWEPETLWVISGDFTHYGRGFGYVPFTADVENNLRDLDGGAIAKITAKDLEGFTDYLDETGATICGRGPISILLAAIAAAAPGATCEKVAYTTSGRVTGDFTQCVSYAALAVRVSPDNRENEGKEMMTHSEKKQLLDLARSAIAAKLAGDKMTLPTRETLTGMLKEPGAAFVTLHARGRLRGCIGTILPQEDLYVNVVENAVNAAFHDPRFLPLTKDEFKDVHIEISVLTPPGKIESWKDFEVGRHGIILSKRGRRAVFLPQVAPEQGWDAETTLTHLALKAGLSADDWRAGAEFHVFEAIVFHEEED
ncbi:MAG: AmmeMemoRadiSam system protein B [Lentisphaeria bacterium]|nr:AmmeMemoRadiSam system protein B [Lentisphaeria bacterium]